jgi:hypothetical protein
MKNAPAFFFFVVLGMKTRHDVHCTENGVLPVITHASRGDPGPRISNASEREQVQKVCITYRTRLKSRQHLCTLDQRISRLYHRYADDSQRARKDWIGP